MRRVTRKFNRFLTEEEMEELVVWQRFNCRKKGGKEGVANVVLDSNKDKFAVLNDRSTHTFCVAETGAGKTYSVLLPYLVTCISNHQSIIVNDCKQELLPCVLPYLEMNGYNTVILNMHCLSRSPDTYNPLQIPFELYKRGDIATAKKITRNLADFMFKAIDSEKDPYFTMAAKSIFNGAVSILMREAKVVEDCTLFNVARLVVDIQRKIPVHNPLQEDYGIFGFDKESVSSLYFDEVSEKSELYCFDSLLNNSEETSRCVYSVFMACIEQYITDTDIRNFLCRSSFNMEEFGKRPTACFVLSSDYETAYDSLVTTFFEQVYAINTLMADNSSKRRLNVPLHFVLDEFANLTTPFASMEKKISTARSRGIRFFLVVQSIAGLRQSYKESTTQAILSNSGLWVVLRSTEHEVQKMVIERLGMTTYPSGKEEPLVTYADLSSMKIGEVLFIYQGKPVFRRVLDFKEMDLPYKPMESYKFTKRKGEKHTSTGWNIIDYCYNILRKRTGLTLEQLKGEQPVLTEEMYTKKKRLQELKIELDLEGDE